MANEKASLTYINCISSTRISESKYDGIFSCAESKTWSLLKNAKNNSHYDEYTWNILDIGCL